MVKTYSSRRDGAVKLSEHFRVREFAEKGTDKVLIDTELVEQLEKLHARLGCSKIVITSGYRTDSAASQHAKGKAADVNCWHMENGKEVRYQGREILLAAEDVGFRGIGWIPGNEQSRAAVHLDTRESPYRFDEADGNRRVKGNSWYAYFGLEKPGEAPSEGTVYQVVKGDTLSKIAARYGVSWQALAEYNGIANPSLIHVGQEIRIPGASGGSVPEAPTKPQKPRAYTVVSGDSLSKIGGKLGVSWRKIAQANGIQAPWVIRPGQVLTIPEA